MQNQVKNYGWLLNQKTKIFFRSNEFKTKMSYVKASLYALLAGTLLSFIIIGANASNPLLFFEYVFKLAFHPLLKDETITYWSIYIVAGLAVAIGFKAGLFNIGVPGQMFLAGSMTIVLGLKNPGLSQGAGVMGALLISIFVGAALAAIAGALKAYFNIHEVVSTIMLNWIVWYIMKWMFMNPANGMWNASQNATTDLTSASPNFNLILNGQTWIIPFIIAMSLLVIIVFVMNYTVLGFRIKAVGKSKNASLYAGTNVKAYTIVSMAISGGIAGILGMLYYMTQSTVLQFSTDALPVVGFDAIAVALVAFTNGFSIIPIGLLWAIIKTAALQTTQLPDFQMSKQMGQLMFGIIIYMTAISALFIYFKPILWIRRWLTIRQNIVLKNEYTKYQNQIKTYRTEIKNLNKEAHKNFVQLKQNDNKEKINSYKMDIESQLTLLVGKIQTLRTEMKFFANTKYKESFKEGKRGIKTKYDNAIFTSIGMALDAFVQTKNEYLTKKQELYVAKQKYHRKNKKLKGRTYQEIYHLKNTDKKELQIKLVNIHSEYGALIVQQGDEIKNVKEKYYPIFDKIQQKFINNYAELKIHEKKTTNELNEELKDLKFKHKEQRRALQFKNANLQKETVHDLKMIKVKQKSDFELQSQILKLKTDLVAQLKELQIKFTTEYEKQKLTYQENSTNYHKKYAEDITMIVNSTKEDNKILKNEYRRKKIAYNDGLLEQKGGN